MRWGLGWLRRKRALRQTIEVLEAIDALERRGRNPSIEAISAITGIEAEGVREAIDRATSQGLVVIEGEGPRLTERGREKILEHRTRYVHDLALRPPPPLATLYRIWEREVGDWENHLIRRHGVDEHVIRGLMNYQGHIEHVVPLTALAEGQRGEVVFVLGGRGAVRRLWDMGVTPGTEVIVAKKAPFMGPIEVIVRGTTLALGRGIASKVFVKPRGELNE